MKCICPICNKEYITRKIVDEIIRDFPDRKEDWVKMECPNSDKHYSIERQKEIEQISKEKQQKVLDLLWSGKSVGEVAKILELDLMIVAEIINQNIETACYLRIELKEEKEIEI